MKNLTSITTQLFSFLFLIILALGTQSTTLSAQEIAVDYVAYKGGKFVQTNSKEWKEYNRENNGKRFIETHRDEWSVYMKTDQSTSRSWQRIQLDLHTKEVKYSDNNLKKPSVLYKINKTIDVDYVAYRGGKFVRTGVEEWKEFNRENNGKRFIETHRDEWSIYMQTASSTNNSWQRIQLDLHTKEVKYTDNNLTTPSVLYKITPTIDVDYVAYKGGRFIRTGVEEWKEYNRENNGKRFVETHRDQWSIYMQTASSTSKSWQRIQLDLHTKEVKYSDNNLRTPSVLYKILPSVNVSKVTYKGGKFIQSGPQEWKEYNKDNKGKVLIETHRDQWSVYMNARDVAKNTWQRIQLDLHTKQVKYADNENTKPSVLYNIIKSNIK